MDNIKDEMIKDRSDRQRFFLLSLMVVFIIGASVPVAIYVAAVAMSDVVQGICK